METYSISHLPAEITLDILSRLPATSVLECKLVCKTWRTLLLSDTHFPEMHLRRQLLQLEQDDDHSYNIDAAVANNKVAGTDFNFMTSLLQDDNFQLYYGEYDDDIDKQHVYKKLTRINHPSAIMGRIVGSCNGLICFSELHKGFADPNGIFNPINKEYVKLPRLSCKTYSSNYMVNGFGYSPSTNEYKVVRIYYPMDILIDDELKHQPVVGHLQVYTLGSGNGWKDKGEITYLLRPWSSGIFINGALHWLDRECKIVAFDLAEEEFCFLPLLPCFLSSRSRDRYSKLLVLGGCLSVFRQKRDKRWEIWSFKPQKKNNTSYGTKEQEHYCWNWTREVIIPSWQGSRNYVYYEPVALTKSGEVLLWHKFGSASGSTLACYYDPKTATLKELVDFRGWRPIEIIPHMNSFVSLKALGENEKDGK